MKKLMSIFGVILFASTLTLTSCGDAAEVNETPVVEEVAAVCSNTGEVCLEDHSCCAADADADVTATDEKAGACCCGNAECAGPETCPSHNGEGDHDH